MLQVLLFSSFFLFVCDEVRSQCYINSDIAIHWSQLPDGGNNPFQENSDQCLADYTIFNEEYIDDRASEGVNCSKRDSTATDGTWTYEDNGTVVDCSADGKARCERGPGSVTLYTKFGCCGDRPYPDGNYTCCIDGSCISIRVYQSGDFITIIIPNSDIIDAVIESCSIIPPSNVTVIPQQYTVQMVTSGVPPIRLLSNIDCTSNCKGATFGESYYTLIDLTEERYQYSRPVTWSPDAASNTNLQYKCSAVFGKGINGIFLNTTLNTSITASNALTINYDVIDATAIRIYWNITGDVNGFIINITSSGLPTVTQQLTDNSTREFIYNGILLEKNYSIEVRGYYQLVGPASTISVILEVIYFVAVRLLSVSDDLSTHHIEVNCFTLRVEPYKVTWRIGLELITPDSTYLRMNGSELLNSVNQTYRQYISLNGSFTNGTNISCSITVNGETAEVEEYILQAASSPPTGLSVRIVSYPSVYVQWNSVSDANGYILQYTPNDETLLVNGSGSLFANTKELTQGTTYQINVYSYRDLPSESSIGVSVLYDVPLITLFNVHPLTPTSVMVSWNTSNSLVDNYTVSYTRLCDNIKGTVLIGNGTSSSTVIDSLYPGFQYSISITATNLLGKGIERNDSVTLETDGPPTGAPLLQPPVVVSSTAVRLSWEEINCTQSNGVIIGYNIQYHLYEKKQLQIMNVSAITNTTLTGLTEFRLYYIRVAAINSNGIGPYSQAISFYTINTSISVLSITTSTRFAKLSWQPVKNVTNVSYTYEVAYISRPDNTECSDDLTTLPDGYTMYLVNTSSDSIEVFGLIPGTCYAFGVRVYTSISDSPGEFTVIQRATVSEVVSGVTSEGLQATTRTSVQLSWTPLITQTDDSLTYEVGYFAQPSNTACASTSLSTLPEGYTSFINTTNSSVVVTGLDSGTCYLFGVRVYLRVYSSRTIPGEWTLIQQQTNNAVTTFSFEPTTTTTTTSTTTITTTTSATPPPRDTATSSGISTGLVGGAAGGGIVAVVIVLLIVIVIVIILRQRSGRKSKLELLNKDNGLYYNEVDNYTKDKPEQEYVEMDTQKKQLDDLYTTVDSKTPDYEAVTGLYANTPDNSSNAVYSFPSRQAPPPLPPFNPMIPETSPIRVNELGNYVSEKHFGMNAGFKAEFQTLYTGEEKSCSIGQRDDYKLLNRFKNITVYDDNRIVLRALPTNTEHNAFINGGFVDGYSSPKKYIATQGPLPKTVGDFWHMVWQEKVQFIVMLTNLMEEKKKKCARYWPEEVNSSETYGHFNVTHLEEEPLLHFVIRILRVELIGTSDSVIVKHYQYITWPDYGVPESVSPFMTLNRRVMNAWKKDKGPIIVHCSAGVGRTGTFIAVDMALEQAEKERKVDIAGIVCKLREQRMKMVQTDAQYAFIHDAVLEAVVVGSTEIAVDLFEAKLMKWRQPASDTGTTSIQTQFELLDLVTPSQDDVLNETAKKFPEKNRLMKFLPLDKWRVLLKGEVPDYIHATSIHGYREKKAFILAQSPMENTAKDFWKMIMSYKVSAIVMCCGEQENGREMCFPYWDQNAPVRFGDLVVEVKSVINETGFIRRELRVHDDKGASANVVQFQFTDWSESGVLKSPRAILDVLDFIGRVQRKSGKGPVVVHCSDTVGCSGVFCAASNAIEQCKTEGLVDVFQATKAVRMHKPGAVTTLEQYDFIHDIIVRYLQQHSTYSNFQIVS